MTAGRGFIALAAVILEGDLLGGPAWLAFLFGLCEAVELRMQFYNTSVPYQFSTCFPYCLALVVLTFSYSSYAMKTARDNLSFDRAGEPDKTVAC